MSTFLNSNNKLLTFIFFVIFFFIGIFIFSDYGISIDEDNTRVVGFLSLESVFKIFSPENIPKIKEIISEQLSEHPSLNIVPTSGVAFDLPMAFLEFIFQIEDSRQYYLLRHFSTFLFFFISSYFFYLLIKQRYNSWIISIIGTIMLIASPKIFANSFYNNKDIIFMSFFIINLYLAINFLEKPNYKTSSIFAIFSALMINVRILGLILPSIIIMFYIINIFRIEKNKKKNINPLITFLILFPVFIFLFWPFLWSDPLKNFLFSFKFLGDHILTIHTFYLGQYIFATNPPWHYHLVWILVSTPLLYLSLFAIGFIFIFLRTTRRLLKIEKNDSYTDLWRSNRELHDLIFLLTFLIPVIIAIDFKSISYDGWRHLFFIYPSLLLVSMFGLNLIRIYFFKKKNNYLYILILALIIPNIFWMYKNHPHQNIYFNFLAGKNFNKKFEMDFSGTSNKHALKYIAEKEGKKVKIFNLSTTDLNLSKNILKNTNRQKISITNDINDADYIINNFRDWRGITRPDEFVVPKNFEIFHEIKIDGISINTIYKKH